MDAGELGEREPVQRNGQENGTKTSVIESDFGNGYSTVVESGTGVNTILVERCTEGEETSDDRRDVRQACNTLTPMMVSLEGKTDDFEEQEDDGPGECKPEGEEEDDWLGE